MNIWVVLQLFKSQNLTKDYTLHLTAMSLVSFNLNHQSFYIINSRTLDSRNSSTVFLFIFYNSKFFEEYRLILLENILVDFI